MGWSFRYRHPGTEGVIMWGFNVNPRDLAFIQHILMKRANIDTNKFTPAKNHLEELREWAISHRKEIKKEIKKRKDKKVL